MSDNKMPLHRHSIYTLCFECQMWGINMPGNTKCGNCCSNDTATYCEIEDAKQIISDRNKLALAMEAAKALDEVLEERMPIPSPFASDEDIALANKLFEARDKLMDILK